MKTQIRSIALGAAAALALSTAAFAGPGGAGHGHGDETAYGKPGDPKKKARIVQVSMTERDGKMLFIPDRIEVRRGEQVRFQLRNKGELDHELVVATLEENLKHAIEMQKNPDMEHDDPNAKRLAPKKNGEILWQFTKAGEFDFSCLIPGHREAGMTGKIIVK
ncbi:MAG: cupredoxin family protein [Bosea sp.]|uniref:cupredoxin domain-containing protein n=2 Tax=Bosea sp. (in: a-proteobacteria) TaxID=1871050 RepID=UPI001AC9EFA4|nr:cupredoxin family protein [Bosea sp. (in: a-proteobacteria)]MBN9472246.1 cupredoxin family protein [Bosea sp. (in: a-proteobacteria)]